MKMNLSSSGLNRRSFLKAAGLVAGTATALGRIPAAAAAESASSAKPYRFGYALNAATIKGQKLGPIEQIETAAKAGYDGYEFWMGDLAKLGEGSALKDLRKRSEDLGLKIINGIGFAAWVVDDDAQRAKATEQMKKEMDVLAQLGGTHIAASPAGVNKTGTKLDLDRAAARYRALLETGRQLGVIPQLEIWGASANLSRVSEAAYVAAQSGHPDACVLADVYHMYRGGSEPAALRVLGRSAVHCFHMNDYPANPPRDTIKDSDRIWPGDGIAPFKQILGALADNHCQVMLSLELFNPEYYKLPALEAAKTGLAKMKAVVAAAGLA
jgi:sugar phosphate isomerase/epimerase